VFVGCNESLRLTESTFHHIQDVKLDEDAWSSMSQEPPKEAEEGESLALPNVNSQKSEISESDQQGSRGGINALVTSNLARKPRWLT
jgi:hypothetical protein